MYALTARVQPCGLYSLRLPYTHQSALVYPLPPPSTVLGLVANALYLHRGPLPAFQKTLAKTEPYSELLARGFAPAPLACLAEVETKARAVAAAPEGKVVVRSAMVKAVTDLAKGTTNALPRQFAHTRTLRLRVGSADADWLQRCAEALRQCPLTLGDSESPIHVEEARVLPAEPVEVQPGEVVETACYLPYALLSDCRGVGSAFFVHERCAGAKELRLYRFPLAHRGGAHEPCLLSGRAAQPFSAFRLGPSLLCVARDQPPS